MDKEKHNEFVSKLWNHRGTDHINAILKEYATLSQSELQLKHDELLKNQEWISVEDRLPESDNEVMIYQKREHHKEMEFSFGAYNKNDIYKWKTNSYMCEDEDLIVTHWKPLPQPPKPNIGA